MESAESLLSRIDERTKRMDESFEKIIDRVDNQEKRLSSIENWRSKIRGIHSAIAVGTSLVGGMVGWFISNKK